MKAAGTTLTVGELRAEIAHLADNDPVYVIDPLDEQIVISAADAGSHNVTLLCDVEGSQQLRDRIEELEDLLGEIRDSSTKGSLMTKSMIIRRTAIILN